MLRGSKRRRTRPRFSDLSPPQRAGVVFLGALEMALLVAAEVDIQRRPPELVVGQKLWWRAVCLINIIGPVGYFFWGRRRTSARTSDAAPSR